MDRGDGGDNNGDWNGIPPPRGQKYYTGYRVPSHKTAASRHGQHPTRQNTFSNRRSSGRKRSSSAGAASANMHIGSLGLKQFLFSIRGRLSASGYVVGSVGLAILISISIFILLPMCMFLPGPIKVLAMVGYVILLIWSCIAITVRRLHDLGHSGWWCLLFLLFLLPLVNVLLSIYLSFWKGKAEKNMFGAPVNPAPLPVAILCYPIYVLAMFLNFLPAASIVPGIDKLPGVRYLMPASEIKNAQDVQQFVDAMPGIARDKLNQEGVKNSMVLVMLRGKMVGAGFFIAKNRILISNRDMGFAINDGLAQQQKLQVKSLDKEAHVTHLVASIPARQWYVFEVDQPIGRPGHLDDANRNALAAIGAFK